jgi:hypothetical protein
MRLLYPLLFFVFSSSINAEVFSCKGESGNIIFTDNKSNCSYSKKIETKNYGSSNNSFYNEIPDILQTKKTANFPGGGKQFCGPVAVSNSLVWLKGIQDEAYQIELVHKLSKPEYMNTNTINGTGTVGLIRGIDKYVTEVWGGYKKLEYSGWRKSPKKYRSMLDKPTVLFMQKGLNRKASAWLNIGWYKLDKLNNEYQRIGGHWVTLVGYEDGRLIIHDPAPRAGKNFSNEFISYSILAAGKLVGNKKGLPKKAKGFIRLENGMHIPKRADAAIIDGVVLLQI